MEEGTIYIVLIFPSPWPPSSKIVLMEKEDVDFKVQITAYADGHLSFFLFKENKILIERHFQRMTYKNDGRAIVCIVWSNNDVQLTLNGDKLLPFSKDENIFVLKEKESQRVEEVIIDLPISENVLEHNERFFIETINDIQEKLKTNRKYEIIKASGLLRLLLLDAEPLIIKINKKFQLKLEFEISDYKEKLPVETNLELNLVNLDVSKFPGAKTVKANLKELLAIKCMIYKTTEISVKDLIKYCAHIKGGIHFGNPEDDIDESLISVDEQLKMVEEESSIILLKGILRIVLKGLIPLIYEISKRVKSY